MKAGDPKKPTLPSEEDPFHLGGPPVRKPPQPKGSMASSLGGSALAKERLAATERAMTPPRSTMPDETPPPLSGPTPATEAPEEQLGPSDQTLAPTPTKPITYQADGDPYTYKLEPDGTITVQSGDAPVATLDKGPTYNAIMGQVATGQLKPVDGPDLTAETGSQARSIVNAQFPQR